MNSPSRIAAPSAVTSVKARFTTAEFLQMVEAGAFDDMKVELVDGELERMNPPMNAHSDRQGRATFRLMTVLGEDRVRVEIGVVLDDATVLGCDVAVLRAPVRDNRMLGVEDVVLVVEIAETTIARDMGMKRAKYASAAIAEYWVVDGGRSVVHVFAEPLDGEYALINTVRFGAPLAVPGTDRTITID